MTTTKNDLRKLDCGKFYTIINVNNPEYADELKKSTELTDEEYKCIACVVDDDMRIKEQISYTRTVFGKSAFIDLTIL